MIRDEDFYEDEVFKLIDDLKILLFPDKWGSEFLDYSKNEILAIVYLYRRKVSTTGDVADYLMSPLNTISGVINRLEKKGLVKRFKDKNDKRIVNIKLTDEGISLYNQEKSEILFYFKEIYNSLTEEERSLAFNVFIKVINGLKKGKQKDDIVEAKEKKVKRIMIE